MNTLFDFTILKQMSLISSLFQNSKTLIDETFQLRTEERKKRIFNSFIPI